mmetsp:Transcript_6355/g.19209  ORF Transcript_6355/g.19209 Transcript_6355/m.19209 type:complete len:104 (-) Transcript_6355:258-569(-)
MPSKINAKKKAKNSKNDPSNEYHIQELFITSTIRRWIGTAKVAMRDTPKPRYANVVIEVCFGRKLPPFTPCLSSISFNAARPTTPGSAATFIRIGYRLNRPTS